MWKLLPVKDSTFIRTTTTDKYRARRANTVVYLFDISPGEEGDGATTYYLNIFGPGGTPLNRVPLFIKTLTFGHIRSRFRYLFEGLAIDIFEKEETVTTKKKEEPKKEQFIIWCPSSDLPPRKIIHSEKVAKAVALEMSKRHKKNFCWCRIEGIVKSQKKVEVTYTEVVTEF